VLSKRAKALWAAAKALVALRELRHTTQALVEEHGGLFTEPAEVLAQTDLIREGSIQEIYRVCVECGLQKEIACLSQMYDLVGGES